ncbi:MAG TPA: pantetheine-phosphate adenylyltransferase [Dissulfurispiraceae bacterium]|nr:pantetheine-phosphate adenylyltransferase [Dissulfurispiraceae bacterium]
MKRGIYPGTFDPVTYGHLDLIKRSLTIFDEVVVAVAPNPKKMPLFTLEERVELIKEAVKDISGVAVEPFGGLLVDYAKRRGCAALIRGLRAVSDYEFEMQMTLMNRRLDKSIETVFLMPSEEHSFISSTIAKEVYSFGGSVKTIVPPNVAAALRKKYPIKKGSGGLINF